jgi:hypothetical protein
MHGCYYIHTANENEYQVQTQDLCEGTVANGMDGCDKEDLTRTDAGTLAFGRNHVRRVSSGALATQVDA